MQVENMSNRYHSSSLPAGLIPDYLSSCASRFDLPNPIQVSEPSRPAAGDLVVARVEEVNPVYPSLELTDDSEVILEPGMTLVGALGTRRALHGFSGRVPQELLVGGPLQLLNKGGVMGECTAFHRNLEWPTLLTYLGTAQVDGVPLNLNRSALPLVDGPLPDVPVVFVFGTCMNSGKTTVCRTIIEGFQGRRSKITAGKVAGVACRKDLATMQQVGAGKALSFHDFGLPSSADIASLVPVARSMIHHLAEPDPDFIVLEMGDGILGGYHVATLFQDQELLNSRACTVVCANDLMGSWGALRWMEDQGYPSEFSSTLVSGPVTDSGEGIRYIEENFKVMAANPFDSPGKLCKFVADNLRG